MTQLLAQKIVLPTIEGQPTIAFEGPLPSTSPGVYRFNNLGDIINTALQYIFPLAGLLLFILIIVAGFQLLVSSGDPKKVEAGSKRITAAIVGFLLLVASYWIVKVVQIIISPKQPFF